MRSLEAEPGERISLDDSSVLWFCIDSLDSWYESNLGPFTDTMRNQYFVVAKSITSRRLSSLVGSCTHRNMLASMHSLQESARNYLSRFAHVLQVRNSDITRLPVPNDRLARKPSPLRHRALSPSSIKVTNPPCDWFKSCQRPEISGSG